MSAAENKQVVQAYLDIVSRQELDRLDEVLAQDIYDHVGEQSGVAWWKQILAKVGDGFSDVTATVVHLVAEDDIVVAHETFTGRQTGTFLPQVGVVKASGAPFVWRHIHIYRVKDGKIVEH